MIAELDLFDESFVQDPHPLLARLRQEAPVHFDSATGLWVVSRYQDVRRVLLDSVAFRPDNAQNAVTPLSVAALRVLARSGFSLPPALANNGGVSHGGLRRLVTRFFNAERVAAAVPVVDNVALELLTELRGRLEAGQPGDLVSDFARILPCRVLMRMLGVHGEDPLTLVRWSDDALELFWGRATVERQVELAESVAAFHQWLSEEVSGGSVDTDSLVGALSQYLLPDGTQLDSATAVAVCFFVLIAGQSTTGQLIATVLRRALEEPGRWAMAGAEPGFAQAWVEEILRSESPVTSWRRTTAYEVELGGVQLAPGSQLLLMLMSTGADPDVFQQPQLLDAHRNNVRHHLAFGAGRHRCPGASLARTEAAIALHAAARSLPDAVTVKDSARSPMLGLLSFRAPLSLPIVLGQVH
ncbi:cytochrome P450 [Streptomyces sp. SLBN-118]|nr:cytochrome P450 [Streptomyces sp. SLBN-118]